MRYAEYQPHPHLALNIQCYWVFEARAATGETHDETLVPDGRCELIFHFGEIYAEVNAVGELQRQPRAIIAGQIDQPLVLRSTGSTGVIGVRFTPWGASQFVRPSMHEFSARRVALSDVWGRAAGDLEEQIALCANDAARVAVLDHALLRRAAPQVNCADAGVVASARALVRSRGAMRIDSLVKLSGHSERKLQRRFQEVVGVSPKLFASILRFHSLFDALSAEDATPWIVAAVDAGYFDQAHMIRDFKRFAGQPPQAFINSASGLTAALVGAHI